MLNIAIVDDNSDERMRLREYAETYCRESSLEAAFILFEDGASFLENYPEAVDIVLLDIEMPRLSGMDTARKLREFDKSVQLLFVTYLVQYAIEGYSVNAADFIPKPVSYPSFQSSMNRVMDKIRFFMPRFLMTSYDKTPILCRIQDISYIESLNKKTIIHLVDGSSNFSSEALYAIEDKLKDEAFFRCHNAFLVNLGHIHTVSGNEALVCGKTIPISKYRKKEFMQTLAKTRGKIL